MTINQMTMARARLALHDAARSFLFDPNVNLIDFGYPMHGGQFAEEELAIRVHVARKLSAPALEAAAVEGFTRPIPRAIADFQTDVLEGAYRLHWWGWRGWPSREPDARASRVEPMRGGISISDEYHYAYGTLGGLVIDRTTGARMILSNWHVLVGKWRALSNQRIYQPGRADGGISNDTVATLTRDAMSVNLDAAVATLNGDRQLLNDQLNLGPVRGVRQAQIGMEVMKSGRASGITYGRVTGVEGFVRMTYDHVERMIRQVVTIEPRSPLEQVSAGGDSGSWWLDTETSQVVGLHFAGSDFPERGLALDMQSVLAALNVDIATDRDLSTYPQYSRTPRKNWATLSYR